MKWNRVRTKGRTRFVANESRGVRLAGGQTARAVLYCLAPALTGRSASVGPAWVGRVCQVCPAVLTVESGAPAVFRQARPAVLAWADSNEAVSNQAVSNQVDSNRAARGLPGCPDRAGLLPPVDWLGLVGFEPGWFGTRLVRTRLVRTRLLRSARLTRGLSGRVGLFPPGVVGWPGLGWFGVSGLLGFSGPGVGFPGIGLPGFPGVLGFLCAGLPGVGWWPPGGFAGRPGLGAG